MNWTNYEIGQASMWITTNNIFKANLVIVEFITSNSNSNRISLPIYTGFIQNIKKIKEKIKIEKNQKLRKTQTWKFLIKMQMRSKEN